MSEHIVYGDDCVDGIVANNEITMMEYLVMEDEELAKFVGKKYVVDYRAIIIASMGDLLD